jgi:hypothetical protein
MKNTRVAQLHWEKIHPAFERKIVRAASPENPSAAS